MDYQEVAKYNNAMKIKRFTIYAFLVLILAAGPIGAQTILSHRGLLAGPHDIQVHSDKAYVAGKYGSFTTLRLSNEGFQILGHIGPEIGECQTIEVINGLYCLAGGDGLFLVGIKDPYRPVILDRIRGDYVREINGIATADDGRFVLSSKRGHLSVVERIGQKINLAGTVDIGQKHGCDAPHDVAVSGHRLITVNQAPGRFPNIFAYRCDPSQRPGEWDLVNTLSAPWFDGANRVIIFDDRAWVASNYANTVAEIDLSRWPDIRPTVLRSTGSQSLPGGGCNGLALKDGLLVAAGEHEVFLFDVSRSGAMTPIDIIRAPSLFSKDGPFSSPHDMEFWGDRIVVTAQQDNAVGLLHLEE